MSITGAAADQISLMLLSPEEALADPDLRRDWEALMGRVHPLHRFLSSPTFVEHQARFSPDGQMRVAVLRNEDARVVGLCPVGSLRISLPLQIRKWLFAKFELRAAVIAGGEPLLPPDPALYRQLFEGIIENLEWCDCVFLPSVPLETDTYRFLHGDARKSARYYIYPRAAGPRPWYTLELGKGLDHFLKSKQKRTRNTLKRRVRKFREHGGGKLECRRIEAEDEVDAFYEAAVRIAGRSWQFRNLGRRPEETVLSRDRLRDLARLGCLSAFLLTCGEEPAAYVVGYRHEHGLQLEETAFAEEFGNLSPGTVLYFLMLQDLYNGGEPPAILDHGIGFAPHKEIYSSHVSYDVSLYLFRRTLFNQLRCLAHGTFDSGLQWAKRLLKKPRRGPEVESESLTTSPHPSPADLE